MFAIQNWLRIKLDNSYYHFWLRMIVMIMIMVMMMMIMIMMITETKNKLPITMLYRSKLSLLNWTEVSLVHLYIFSTWASTQ